MSAWDKRLAAQYPKARELYERAAPILGFDLASLCFEGPAAELDSTVISQPALFVTSLAALEKVAGRQSGSCPGMRNCSGVESW